MDAQTADLAVLGKWNGYRVLVATKEKLLFVPVRDKRTGKIIVNPNTGKPKTRPVLFKRIYVSFGGFTYSAGIIGGEVRVHDPRPRTGALDYTSKPLANFARELRRMLGDDGALSVNQQIVGFLRP